MLVIWAYEDTDWAEICLKAVPMDLAFEQVQVRTTWQQRIEQVLQGNSSISSVEKAEAWLGLASLAIADGNLSLAYGIYICSNQQTS